MKKIEIKEIVILLEEQQYFTSSWMKQKELIGMFPLMKKNQYLKDIFSVSAAYLKEWGFDKKYKLDCSKMDLFYFKPDSKIGKNIKQKKDAYLRKLNGNWAK